MKLWQVSYANAFSSTAAAKLFIDEDDARAFDEIHSSYRNIAQVADIWDWVPCHFNTFIDSVIDASTDDEGRTRAFNKNGKFLPSLVEDAAKEYKMTYQIGKIWEDEKCYVSFAWCWNGELFQRMEVLENY